MNEFKGYIDVQQAFSNIDCFELHISPWFFDQMTDNFRDENKECGITKPFWKEIAFGMALKKLIMSGSKLRKI